MSAHVVLIDTYSRRAPKGFDCRRMRGPSIKSCHDLVEPHLKAVLALGSNDINTYFLMNKILAIRGDTQSVQRLIERMGKGLYLSTPVLTKQLENTLAITKRYHDRTSNVVMTPDEEKNVEISAQAMLALGKSYRQEKRYELALLALTYALFNPQFSEAYYELGLLMLDRRNKPDEGNVHAQASEAYLARAAESNWYNKNVTAEVLNRAMVLGSERAEYFHDLGNALRRNEQYEEAELAYRKALEL